MSSNPITFLAFSFFLHSLSHLVYFDRALGVPDLKMSSLFWLPFDKKGAFWMIMGYDIYLQCIAWSQILRFVQIFCIRKYCVLFF